MCPVSGKRADRLVDAPPVMKWSVCLAAAGVDAYLCLLILRPFSGAVAWSTVLARAVPFIGGLSHAALSAFITSALLVLAVLVPLVFLGAVLSFASIAAAMFLLLGCGERLVATILDRLPVKRTRSAAKR
jgi:hypothetical protein